MYAWKCWRETRARFITLLTISVAVAILLVLSPGLKDRNGWWSFDRSEYTHDPALMVRLISSMVLSGIWPVGIFAGAFLGVTSSGSEIEPGTIEYLWTRPRTRASMNWTYWAICVAEIFLVAAVPLYLAAALTGSLTGNWNQWLLLLAPLLIALVGLPVLGLAILMSAWRRSTSGGLIFTSGIVVVYAALRQIATGPLHLHIPPFFMGPIVWITNYYFTPSRMLFPWSSLACSLGFAVALPFLAQWVLKRAEI